MGYKIFVSYKYHDTSVYPLKGYVDEILSPTKVRDYVDKLESYFDKTSNIYKGESEGEDLSDLSDDAIWENLKPRIYDSSATIVLISPRMKEQYKAERNQWIPWEIAYLLRETTRGDKTSHSNAVLAVILPDRNNEYFYYSSPQACFGGCSCIHYQTESLFSILKNNMFNQRYPKRKFCEEGKNVFLGDYSYVLSVNWCDFIRSPMYYIDHAVQIKEHIEDYDISKEV